MLVTNVDCGILKNKKNIYIGLFFIFHDVLHLAIFSLVLSQSVMLLFLSAMLLFRSTMLLLLLKAPLTLEAPKYFIQTIATKVFF